MGLLIEEILPLARQWEMDILSTGFLTVEVSAQNYAIPLGRVIGIVQSGPLTPLPFSPPQFEGLVLAMGQVVPQISLAILLGMPSKEGGVVVLLSDLGGSIGLRVDAVHAMLHVEGSQVAVATPAMRAERPLILGRFGDAPASYDILQLDHLTDGEFVQAAAGDATALLAEAPDSIVDLDEATDRQLEPYVVFSIGDDIYAIKIEYLIEILELSPTQAVPHAPPWVDGMIDVRGEPILGLSLAALLGGSRKESGQLGLMIALAVESVGFADEINMPRAARVVLVAGRSFGIERYGSEQVHALHEPIGGIESYFVRSDDKVVGIIDPTTLVRPVGDAIAAWVPQPQAVSPVALPEPGASVHQYLTVRVGRELLAVPIDRIHRLQASVILTPIPESDTGFDAVADVGDGVVPVIDLRRILAADGEPAADDLPSPCLLAVIGGGMAGIVVDRILHVENISDGQFEPAGESPLLPVSHILRLNGQLMSVLSLDRLLPPL
jgi:purine-binding chemotaxis protein CheW